MAFCIPKGLEGTGDNTFSLGTNQGQVKLAIINNGLDGQTSGRGAASNAPESIMFYIVLYYNNYTFLPITWWWKTW